MIVLLKSHFQMSALEVGAYPIKTFHLAILWILLYSDISNENL